MKILHIDITGPYTEGATYQENLLPSEQCKKGHDVVIWASSYEWNNGEKVYIGQIRKTLSDGVILQRLDYKHIFNSYITNKLRLVSNVYELLLQENPNTIMVHDGQTAIIPDVCKYVGNHPGVKLIADSHIDPINSGTNWISKNILHKLIYKRYIKNLYNQAETMYCITPEGMRYVSELYGLGKEKLQFLPLGGTIIDDDTYSLYRNEKRKELALSDLSINIIHSGKLSKNKYTLDLLDAFKKIINRNIHLTIIGSAEGEILQKIKDDSRSDSRITWVGWKSGDELIEYLCSGDIYILPRSVSATVQTSMCCRCVPIIYPYELYKEMKLNNICYVKNKDELEKSIRKLTENKELLSQIKNNVYTYAKYNLDYSYQADLLI